jgi:integrase
MRYQKGYIYEAAQGFYVRYYAAGKQVSHRLASKDDKHYSRTCRAVKLLSDEFMREVNAGAGALGNVQSTTVAEFWENTYLPFAIANLRHSTVYGYRQIWDQHFAGHFGTLTLQEYRTHMGSKFLTELSKTLCRSTLQHIRSLASGIFSHALNLGLIESNPWHDVKILGRTIAPKDTPHYTLEQVEDMISALVDHPDCLAVLALACFVGLRPGEIQGLQWGDVEADWIHIRRAIVRGKEGGLKTASSAASLPLIAPVKIALSAWRSQCPEGDRVFPKSLNEMVRNVISPILEEKDIEWKGLYAGRRGAATILTELTGDALAAKELLRHANIGVTQLKYVKKIPEALLRGMKLLEAETQK